MTGVEDLSNNPDFKESSAVEQEDESEIAKKHHDTFNLIALVRVCVCQFVVISGSRFLLLTKTFLPFFCNAFSVASFLLFAWESLVTGDYYIITELVESIFFCVELDCE